jgi:hypothetical protein
VIQRGIKLVVILVLGAVLLSLVRVSDTVAQEAPGTWSEPVRLSANTASAWFSDVAVDDFGRAYVVWHVGRTVDDVTYDLLMYRGWDGSAWSSSNDIIAVGGIGRYLIRPALVVDRYGTLHMSHRRHANIHYAHADALNASVALSWETSKRLSSGPAYYSDLAVDDGGRIHIVWNEQIPPESHKVLWFGSPDGILRFDEYAGWDEIPWPGGLDRTVHTVFEDSTGMQWIGTSNGVGRYDGVTWQWFTPEDGVGSAHIYAIAEDAYNMLWFGGDRGVTCYDPLLEEKAERWRALDFVQTPVQALAVDTDGELWMGTSGGLVRYDGWEWGVYSSTHGLAADAVTAIATDPEGVFVGTNSGLSRYDGVTWHTFRTEDGLIDNHVTALVADQRSGLWVGTKRGVSRYDGRVWTSFTSANGLIDDHITALTVDSDGVVWVGTPKGASSFDGMVWTSYTADEVGDGRPITAVAQDRVLNAFCAFCSDVFYRHSDDGGQTWSDAVNLSGTIAGSVKPQVKLDHSSGVHVVWEEGEDQFAGGGYPIASAYVRSLDGGVTWSAPFFFTHTVGSPQQITVGVGREKELIAVWRLPENDKQVYYQRSTDNGDTWSEARPIPGIIAKDWNPMSLDSSHSATDGAGNFHVLLVGNVASSQPAIDVPTSKLSVIHVFWNGSGWSSPSQVFTSLDPPEWPRIAIGKGNRVFATWFTRDRAHIWDSERGRYQVWAASMLADAPTLIPLPSPTPSPTPASAAVTKATPSPTAAPTLAVVSGSSGLPPGLDTESDEIAWMIVALSPTAVIALIIIGVRTGRFGRRR